MNYVYLLVEKDYNNYSGDGYYDGEPYVEVIEAYKVYEDAIMASQKLNAQYGCVIEVWKRKLI